MPTALAAISPIDGRYASKTAPLAAYFSEYALIKYRVVVEVRYLTGTLPHRSTPATVCQCGSDQRIR